MADLPETVTAATLADLIGLTANRVNALARDGAIPRSGRNCFPLPDAVRAYVEWAKANPAGRRVKDPDLADEKLRLAREQADKLALQNAKTRGGLVPVAEVRAAWLTLAADLKARLLSIGPRVAAQVGLDRVASAALDAEIRRAMAALASDGLSHNQSEPLVINSGPGQATIPAEQVDYHGGPHDD